MTEPTIEDRFVSLEHSNSLLAGDVQALTAAISVVNRLQVEQREIKRRASEAAERVEQVDREAVEREERTRRVIRGMGLAAAVLIPLACLLLYVGLIKTVDGLLSEGNSERLASCKQRNAGTASQIRREESLAAVDINPRTAAIHRNSAEELRRALVNCKLVYGPGNG